ncbi:YopX family protein [Exiguobacterium sp. s133]|uniref:YopX family protein n=1 Tax=Exiguobacterium sp. s133 TaxID=2751213 RepID=UPI001BEBDE24|nr:YopX family protein [Exiguobacterium sp. s133]
MRVPKFRAWERALKEMIPVHNINFETKIINARGAWRTFDEIDLVEYTGVKDMKGVEICEGDILYCPEYKDRINNRIVKFEHGQFIGVLNNGYSKPVNQLTWDMEVIGNIYENPNLFDQN